MAIKVNGTTVINDSRALTNVSSIDATTATAIGAAGVGGSPAAGTLGGPLSKEYTNPTAIDGVAGRSMDLNSGRSLFFGTTNNVGFIFTHRQGYRTTNGGVSYTRLFDYNGSNNSQMVTANYQSPCAWDDNNNIVVSNSDYYGGILYSSNGGASFSLINPFGQTGPSIQAPWALGNNTFMVGQGSVTKRSTNGGASWSTAGSERFYNGYTSTNGTTLAISNNGLRRSTNARTGFTWTTVISVSGFETNQSIATNNSGLWVLGDGRYSANDGVTWSGLTDSPNALQSVRFINGYFTAIKNGDYAYTTNPANGWTHLSSGFGTNAVLKGENGDWGSTTQGYGVTSPTKQLSLSYKISVNTMMATTAMTFA